MQVNRLNPKQIDTLPAGTHGDGNNLYLVVKDTGSRSYMLRYSWHGRMQKMGLGATAKVKLAAARDAAIDANRLLAKGINPRDQRDEQRRAESGGVLFYDFAEDLLLKREKGFKNKAHKAKWKYNVQTRFKPLHQKRLDLVETADVLSVLEPDWLRFPIAAKDARQHLEVILSAATAAGHRKVDAANPARWKGHLEHLLPKTRRKGKVKGPHSSLPYEDLPAFMTDLRGIDATSARMLETSILTCARTNEIINMRWSQIDLQRALWCVPRELMKMDRDHIVPLSGPTMTFLASAFPGRLSDDGFVFQGRKRGERMSNMAMLEFLKYIGRTDITVHGFRSTFKTWCDEETNFSNQAVEFCVAHVPGDEAEKAYRRRSMLAKRRQIMGAWAAFATKPLAKVIGIENRRAA
jgi:integrase